jgi:hypothetical protein
VSGRTGTRIPLRARSSRSRRANRASCARFSAHGHQVSLHGKATQLPSPGAVCEEKVPQPAAGRGLTQTSDGTGGEKKLSGAAVVVASLSRWRM